MKLNDTQLMLLSSASKRDDGLRLGADAYFETGATITALILLGRYFETRSRGQASEAIHKLMQLGAKTARPDAPVASARARTTCSTSRSRCASSTSTRCR